MNTTSLTHRAAWNALASVLASFGRLLAGIMLARLLGNEALGVYGYAVWLVEFAVLIVSFGLPQALTRFLAHAQGGGRTSAGWRLLLRLAWTYAVVSVLGAAALYGLVRLRLGVAVDHTLAGPLALLLALQLWAGLSQAALTGLQRFKSLARLNAANVLVLLAGQFVGASLAGVWGVILGTAAAYAVTAAALWRLIFVQANPFRERDESEGPTAVPPNFLNYAASAWVAAVVSAVTWGRAEIYFIERYADHTQVGYFTVGLLFSSLVIQVISLMAGALLPHFSMLSGADAQARLKSDYRRLTLYAAMVAFPLSLGGAALMPELVRVVFGAQYMEAVTIARLLMLAGLWAFATVGSAVVYGLGEAGLVMRWSFLGALLMVLGCLWLVPTHGASGAAATRVVVHGAMILIGAWLLRTRYGMPFPGRQLLRLALAACLCATAAWLVAQVVLLPWAALTLGTLTGAVAYLAALRALGCILPDEGRTLATLIARFPTPIRRSSTAVLSWVVQA